MTDTHNSRSNLPESLLDPNAYPHPVEGPELYETHISWVVLTGKYAYKAKKPLRLPFLDFSTLERRKYFVDQELELNRRFAPELYLERMAIVRRDSGVRVLPTAAAGDAEVLDWCLRMRQFDNHDRLDACVQRGAVDTAEAAALAEEVARVHARLPVAQPDGDWGQPDAVVQPALDNFDALPEDLPDDARAAADALLAWTRERAETLRPVFAERLAAGAVRECHGDLHLSNIVRWQGGHRLFDCIEFDPALRWIDVTADIAFLFMDLLVRDEPKLAWAVLDAWLAASGDYAAGRLLDWYVVYRSMVRAKVAGLQAAQVDGEERAQHRQRLQGHLDLAARISQRRAPRLLLMCGLSGSGKSWWAERLVPALGAVRLRSDVERKRLHGLAAQARSGSTLDGGIYTAAATAQTYDRLADCAGNLLAGGVDTIVDATFLDAAQRQRFAALGAEAGARTALVLCTAPEAVLRERVAVRSAAGSDASEAGTDVLEQQLSAADLPAPGSLDCPVVSVGPENSLEELLARLDEAL